MLSLKNVGIRSFHVDWMGMGFLSTVAHPEVLIRNSKGDLLEMTKAGREVYATQWGYAGSGDINVDLHPGHAWEGELSIRKHFDLSVPGKYTVLASVFLGWDGGKRLVAKPLVLEVLPSSDSSLNEESPAAPLSGKSYDTAPVTEIDKEWSELLAKAGVSQEGWQLQAALSPVEPEALHLVISRMCVYLIGRHEYARKVPEWGQSPSDYCILVRDSFGKVVSAVSQGDQHATKRWKYDMMWPGAAIGTVVSLKKLFKMTEPGEYTVLATLPPQAGKGAVLVAQPITVNVAGPGPEEATSTSSVVSPKTDRPNADCNTSRE